MKHLLEHTLCNTCKLLKAEFTYLLWLLMISINSISLNSTELTSHRTLVMRDVTKPNAPMRLIAFLALIEASR